MAGRLGKVSLKLFIICIISFLIELVGLTVISVAVKGVFRNYNTLISEGVENTICMERISKLIAEEKVVSSLYVLSTTDDFLPDYKEKEYHIRTNLSRELSEFEKRMRGMEKEQIFHNLNFGCHSIFTDISIAMTLRESGSKTIAEQYISKTLIDSYEEINANLEELSIYINKEMNESRRKMDTYSRISGIFIWASIIILAVTIVWFIIVCVRFTTILEKHKNSLKTEVSRKTRQLVEKNSKIIYIQEQTILGMANVIESRDSDTGEHVKRTGLYVELLVNAAREFGYYTKTLTDHYVKLLKKAAPMHDVGKIVVSDSILQKPSRLTPEEFEQIKIHTTAGEKIIRDVLGKIESEDYVQMAVDVAKCHHEHWDGTGYPNHLKGEQIPLCARIMAVADVFDALVSQRCYKKPFAPEYAFELIQNDSGSYFDPILVTLFLKKKNEVLKILESN